MAAFLPEAVRNVVNNDYDSIEIIIVDDGSDDTSFQTAEEIAKSFRSNEAVSIKVLSIPHSGKAAALNAAMKQSKGDFVTFLDADDLLPQDSLSSRMERITDTDADLVLGEFEVISDAKLKGRRSIPTENQSKLLHKFLYNWRTPFHLNAVLIKKSLLTKIGPFDECLIRGQEKDYSVRLLKIKPDIAFIHKPVYYYRKYRTFSRRIRIRMKTVKYTFQLLSKHTSGIEKVAVIIWNIMLEVLKFIYELFGSYKR